MSVSVEAKEASILQQISQLQKPPVQEEKKQEIFHECSLLNFSQTSEIDFDELKKCAMVDLTNIVNMNEIELEKIVKSLPNLFRDENNEDLEVELASSLFQISAAIPSFAKIERIYWKSLLEEGEKALRKTMLSHSTNNEFLLKLKIASAAYSSRIKVTESTNSALEAHNIKYSFQYMRLKSHDSLNNSTIKMKNVPEERVPETVQLALKLLASFSSMIDFTKPSLCAKLISSISDSVKNLSIKSIPNSSLGVFDSISAFLEKSIEKDIFDVESLSGVLELLMRLLYVKGSIADLLLLLKSLFSKAEKVRHLKVRQIISDLNKSLPLYSRHKKASDVFAFGRGDSGRLGLGPNKTTLQEPKCIETLQDRDIVQTSTFSTHTLALSKSGEVFAWGNGQHGRLGTKSVTYQFIPIQLVSLTDVKIVQIAVGLSHSVILSESGYLYTFGSGLNGRLGHGDTKERLEPSMVSGFQVDLKGGLYKLACGSSFSFVISSGKLYSWGKNTAGQCGQGGYGESLTPKQVKSLDSEIVVDIAGGWDHAVACCESGLVYTWGCGYEGNRPVLGNGSSVRQAVPKVLQSLVSHKIIKVAAGYDHSLVLTASGDIYSWGSNVSGQLGLGTFNEQLFPQLVPGMESNKFVKIFGGMDHSMAITESGELFSWGNGTESALGHSSSASCNFPTKVSFFKDKFVVHASLGDKCSIVVSADPLKQEAQKKIADVDFNQIFENPYFDRIQENTEIMHVCSVTMHIVRLMDSFSRSFCINPSQLWGQNDVGFLCAPSGDFEAFAIAHSIRTFRLFYEVLKQLMSVNFSFFDEFTSESANVVCEREEEKIDDFVEIRNLCHAYALVTLANSLHAHIFQLLISQDDQNIINEEDLTDVFNDMKQLVLGMLFNPDKALPLGILSDQTLLKTIQSSFAECLVIGMEFFFSSREARLKLLHSILQSEFSSLSDVKCFGKSIEDALLSRLSEHLLLRSLVFDDKENDLLSLYNILLTLLDLICSDKYLHSDCNESSIFNLFMRLQDFFVEQFVSRIRLPKVLYSDSNERHSFTSSNVQFDTFCSYIEKLLDKIDQRILKLQDTGSDTFLYRWTSSLIPVLSIFLENEIFVLQIRDRVMHILFKLLEFSNEESSKVMRELAIFCGTVYVKSLKDIKTESFIKLNTTESGKIPIILESFLWGILLMNNFQESGYADCSRLLTNILKLARESNNQENQSNIFIQCFSALERFFECDVLNFISHFENLCRNGFSYSFLQLLNNSVLRISISNNEFFKLKMYDFISQKISLVLRDQSLRMNMSSKLPESNGALNFTSLSLTPISLTYGNPGVSFPLDLGAHLSELCISFWVKVKKSSVEPSSGQLLFHRGNLNPLFSSPSVFIRNNRLEVVISLSDGKSISVTLSKEIVFSKWTHLALSLKTRQIAVFVDGKINFSKNTQSDIELVKVEPIFYFGGIISSPGLQSVPDWASGFDGSISDVRVYQRAVDEALLANQVASGPFRNCSSYFSVLEDLLCLHAFLSENMNLRESDVSSNLSMLFAVFSNENSFHLKFLSLLCIHPLLKALNRDQVLEFFSSDEKADVEDTYQTIIKFFMNIGSSFYSRSTLESFKVLEKFELSQLLSKIYEILQDLCKGEEWRESFLQLAHIQAANLQEFELESIDSVLSCLPYMQVFCKCYQVSLGRHAFLNCGSDILFAICGLRDFEAIVVRSDDWDTDRSRILVHFSGKNYLFSESSQNLFVNRQFEIISWNDQCTDTFLMFFNPLLEHLRLAVIPKYSNDSVCIEPSDIFWILLARSCFSVLFYLLDKYPKYANQLLDPDIVANIFGTAILQIQSDSLKDCPSWKKVLEKLSIFDDQLTLCESESNSQRKNLSVSKSFVKSDAAKLIKCPLCNTKDLSCSAFFNHVEKSHSGMALPVKPCPICNFDSTVMHECLPPNLWTHLQMRHMNLKADEINLGADSNAAAESSVDQEKVAQLMSMGFPTDHCVFALEQTAENVLAATNWLLNNMGSIPALIESKRAADEEKRRRIQEEEKQLAIAQAEPYTARIRDFFGDFFKSRDFKKFAHGYDYSSSFDSLLYKRSSHSNSLDIGRRKVYNLRDSLGNISQGLLVDNRKFFDSCVDLCVLLNRAISLRLLEACDSSILPDHLGSELVELFSVTLSRGELFAGLYIDISSFDSFGYKFISLSWERFFSGNKTIGFIPIFAKYILTGMNNILKQDCIDDVVYGSKVLEFPDSNVKSGRHTNFEGILFLCRMLFPELVQSHQTSNDFKSTILASFGSPNVGLKIFSLYGLIELDKLGQLENGFVSSDFISDVFKLYNFFLQKEFMEKRAMCSQIVFYCFMFLSRFFDLQKSPKTFSDPAYLESSLIKFCSSKIGSLKLSNDFLKVTCESDKVWKIAKLMCPIELDRGGIHSFLFKIDSTVSSRLGIGFIDDDLNIFEGPDCWLGSHTKLGGALFGDQMLWFKGKLSSGNLAYSSHPLVSGTYVRLYVNTIRKSISYAINDRYCGIAFFGIDAKRLYPAICLYSKGDSISLIPKGCFSVQEDFEMHVLEFSAFLFKSNDPSRCIFSNSTYHAFQYMKTWLEGHLKRFQVKDGAFVFLDQRNQICNNTEFKIGTSLIVGDSKPILCGAFKGKSWFRFQSGEVRPLSDAELDMKEMKLDAESTLDAQEYHSITVICWDFFKEQKFDQSFVLEFIAICDSYCASTSISALFFDQKDLFGMSEWRDFNSVCCLYAKLRYINYCYLSLSSTVPLNRLDTIETELLANVRCYLFRSVRLNMWFKSLNYSSISISPSVDHHTFHFTDQLNSTDIIFGFEHRFVMFQQFYRFCHLVDLDHLKIFSCNSSLLFSVVMGNSNMNSKDAFLQVLNLVRNELKEFNVLESGNWPWNLDLVLKKAVYKVCGIFLGCLLRLEIPLSSKVSSEFTEALFYSHKIESIEAGAFKSGVHSVVPSICFNYITTADFVDILENDQKIVSVREPNEFLMMEEKKE